MSPVIHPVLRSIAFLMVMISIPGLLLSSSWVSGFLLVTGLTLYWLANPKKHPRGGQAPLS